MSVYHTSLGILITLLFCINSTFNSMTTNLNLPTCSIDNGCPAANGAIVLWLNQPSDHFGLTGCSTWITRIISMKLETRHSHKELKSTCAAIVFQYKHGGKRSPIFRAFVQKYGVAGASFKRLFGASLHWTSVHLKIWIGIAWPSASTCRFQYWRDF